MVHKDRQQIKIQPKRFACCINKATDTQPISNYYCFLTGTTVSERA